ncbi:peptidyl-prolyl cis-trans isomerase [Fulvivirga imtechensis AK7]|uniref:Peptidyl-prolyl cis-trans isomerase n=1 Tax=Fulvivirga imtechensis AK7 TaxID=1237149 RepID=L8JNZ3_9BACT|nr:FKBP-type peptidyl-prolyl cis-trans isomerase [Fulvivirga imtechensis]ELR70560.1 peptidyl-prolyl cis-trans isomerase [Fulvivirga imtechensis AK7]
MKSKRTVYRLLYMMLAVMLLGACELEKSEFEKRREREEAEIKDYLKEHNISAIRDPSGIYYLPLKENPQGKSVSTNDVISIYYTMRTLEGKLVGQTTDSLAPVVFGHNFKSLIPLGLDYGIHLMNKGEKYRFFIPSTMAYGDYGDSDFFEPGSIFIIDVELVEIQTESQINELEMAAIENYIDTAALENVQAFSSGLRYKQLEEGAGVKPLEHSRVTFHFARRYLNGTLIEKTNTGNPVSVQLSSGVVPGLKEGLLQMKKGGKALLIMPSKIAFGESIQVLPTTIREELIKDHIIVTKAQPYSPLIYEVALVDVGN